MSPSHFVANSIKAAGFLDELMRYAGTDQGRKALTGAAVGAGAGGLLGGFSGGGLPSGLLGALMGAGVGGYAGHSLGGYQAPAAMPQLRSPKTPADFMRNTTMLDAMRKPISDPFLHAQADNELNNALNNRPGLTQQ